MTHPQLLQFNTQILLAERGRQLGGPRDIQQRPRRLLGSRSQERIRLGVAAWQTGPASRQVSRNLPDLRRSFRQALPNLTEQDITGSPFAIRGYPFAPSSAATRRWSGLAPGSPELAFTSCSTSCRTTYRPQSSVAGPAPGVLHRRGRASHRGRAAELHTPGDRVGSPHPRLRARPVFSRLVRHAAAQLPAPGPPQGNDRAPPVARAPLRWRAMRHGHARAAGDLPADGGQLPLPSGRPVDTPFWPEAIRQAREENPRFSFMAEVYWDLEWELQRQGSTSPATSASTESPAPRRCSPSTTTSGRTPTFSDNRRVPGEPTTSRARRRPSLAHAPGGRSRLVSRPRPPLLPRGNSRGARSTRPCIWDDGRPSAPMRPRASSMDSS